MIYSTYNSGNDCVKIFWVNINTCSLLVKKIPVPAEVVLQVFRVTGLK